MPPRCCCWMGRMSTVWTVGWGLPCSLPAGKVTWSLRTSCWQPGPVWTISAARWELVTCHNPLETDHCLMSGCESPGGGCPGGPHGGAAFAAAAWSRSHSTGEAVIRSYYCILVLSLDYKNWGKSPHWAKPAFLSLVFNSTKRWCEIFLKYTLCHFFVK